MGRAQAGLYELDRDVQVGGATAGRKGGSRRARGAGIPSKSTRTIKSSEVDSLRLEKRERQMQPEDTEAVGPAARADV